MQPPVAVGRRAAGRSRRAARYGRDGGSSRAAAARESATASTTSTTGLARRPGTTVDPACSTSSAHRAVVATQRPDRRAAQLRLGRGRGVVRHPRSLAVDHRARVLAAPRADGDWAADVRECDRGERA